MASDNHFISVSRAGVLMARRKGCAPVAVATVDSGILVQTDDQARAQGAPPQVLVRFAPGGANRMLRVTAVEFQGVSLDVDGFLSRFGVSESAFGRWLRAAVERALDLSNRSACE